MWVLNLRNLFLFTLPTCRTIFPTYIYDKISKFVVCWRMCIQLKKHNANGHAYGFVYFCNVKDVGKLSEALNNVYFGNYRVSAKVEKV